MADAFDTTDFTVDFRSVGRASDRRVAILQIVSGPEEGRVLVLEAGRRITVGRSRDCDLAVRDPSCSRRHAEFSARAPDVVELTDLDSRNGTRRRGEPVHGTVTLEDGDRIELGEQTVLRFGIVTEPEARMQEEVYRRSTQDPLTGACNRRRFDDILAFELARVERRTRTGLGLAILDVDHFKAVNDTFGHLAGDEVLREIGRRVPALVRRGDLFARLGGEEFAVVVRDDDVRGVTALAERIRAAIEAAPVPYEGRDIAVTVSIGATLLPGGSKIDPQGLVRLADDALYEAKRTGRNRSVVKLPAAGEGDAPPTPPTVRQKR